MPEPVFRLNATEALKEWQEFAGALADKRPLLRIAGAWMVRSIQQTFMDSGSPSGSWRRLYAGTLRTQFERRRRRKIGPLTARQMRAQQGTTAQGGDTAAFSRFAGGKRILISSGQLRKSITYAVEPGQVRIGTNLKYGRIHQLGGVITPKTKKFLRFPIGGGQFVFAKRVVMPARPFIVMRPEDPAKIAEGMRNYLRATFDPTGSRPAAVPYGTWPGGGGAAPTGEW